MSKTSQEARENGELVIVGIIAIVVVALLAFGLVKEMPQQFVRMIGQADRHMTEELTVRDAWSREAH